MMYLRLISCFVSIFFVTQSLWADTNNQPPVNKQVAQVKKVLNHFENKMTQKNAKLVYFGNAEAKRQQPILQFMQMKKAMFTLLKSIENNKPSSVLKTLQWQPMVQSDRATSGDFINANINKTPVNICRANFIGANTGNQAVYPGQLHKLGCRISYAGYAFYMSKFSVLTGNSDGLRWIPIAKVKQAIKKQSAKNNQPKKNARAACLVVW